MTLSQSTSAVRENAQSLHTPGFGLRIGLRAMNAAMRENFLLFLLRSGLSAVEPVQKFISEQLAVLEAQRAYNHVAAYRTFIDAHGGINGADTFCGLPETSKDRYIKPALADDPLSLYVGNTVPFPSAWDTSTGTSGRPTSWYRGSREVRAAHRLLNFRARVMIGKVPYIFMNGFALGCWATGLTAARAVGHSPHAIAHNIGPNPELILQMIQESWQLFPGRLVVVAGYPPHIEQIVLMAQERGIPLHEHATIAVVGGEAMSEVQRNRIKAHRSSGGNTTGFQEVYSFYGASDIDINIGIETTYTMGLRAVLNEHPSVARDLFGSNVPFVPMIFAYDPLSHLIEVNDQGQLVYTELTGSRISPRIRYNLGDKGMVRSFSEVNEILKASGIVLPLTPGCRTPLVFVWGRVEDGITYRGANLAWENLHEAIRRLNLVDQVQGFGIAQYEAEGHVFTDFLLHVPEADVADALEAEGPQFLTRVVESLGSLNHDFRYQVQCVTNPADLPRIRLYRTDSPMAEHARQNPARKQKHIFLGTDVERVVALDGGGLIIAANGEPSSHTVEASPPVNNLREVWESILLVARRYPSPHNVQSGELDINGDGSAQLYINGRRTFPFTDHTGSFVISSMAMFVRYLEEAAQNRGFLVKSVVYDVSELDLTARRSLFATLQLEQIPGLAPSRFSDEDLIRRKTSRKPNLMRPVPEDVLRTIQGLVESYDYGLQVISDQATIEAILRRDITALFEDINDPRYFSELKPLLKLGKKANCRDGLHYKVMNLPAVQYAAMKHLPQLVQVPGLAPVMTRVYRSQLGHCEHIAIVSGKFWRREDSLDAGRMLVDLWLTLSSHGIFIHPFGNLVTNREARAEIESLTGVKGMWFVCRFGYTDEPEESNRLSIPEIAKFVG